MQESGLSSGSEGLNLGRREHGRPKTRGALPFMFVNNYNSNPTRLCDVPGRRALISAHAQRSCHRKKKSSALLRLRSGRRHPRPFLRSGSKDEEPSLSSSDVPPEDSSLSCDSRHELVELVEPAEDSRRATTKNRRNQVMELTASGCFQTSEEDREHDGSVALARRITSIPSLLDQAEIDPFQPRTTDFTKGMKSTLHYFLEIINPRIFPIREREIEHGKFVMATVGHDHQPALLGLLALAAIDLRSRRGELSNLDNFNSSLSMPMLEFVKYKYQAIKALNAAIATNGKEMLGIPTICGIVWLTAIELTAGNIKEIAIHLRGLNELVTLRGGLHGFPSEVLELTLQVIYHCAAMTRSLPLDGNWVADIQQPKSYQYEPPYTHSSTGSGISTTTSSSLSDLQDLGSDIIYGPASKLFDARITQAALSLRETVLSREYFIAYPLQNPPPAAVEYLINSNLQAQYALLSIPFLQIDGNPRHSTSISHAAGEEDENLHEEACRMALLIFSQRVFEDSSTSTVFSRNLAIQLRRAVNHLDMSSNHISNHVYHPHSASEPFANLYVWILFLGVYITAGQKERPWFVSNLATSVSSLKLHDVDDLKRVLRRFFYVERVYGASVGGIWDEVEAATREKSAG